MAADAPAVPRFRLATFDLDGTLTRVHGWSVIAEATGRMAEYNRSNARFVAHEIGEDEHLQDLLDMAVGLSRAEVERLLEATPKVDGIAEAVGRLRAEGRHVALLTHNPDYVCEWYARRFGFEATAGTDGTVFDGAGRIVAAGRAVANKPAGLARLLDRFSLDASECVHVGDGWADARVFPLVGGGIAFNTRFPEVARAADVALRGPSLEAVAQAIASLRPRPPLNGGRPPDEPSNR